MDNLRVILESHQGRHKKDIPAPVSGKSGPIKPSVSEIPDLFFDEILIEFKLTRIETIVLMHLYRKVWCKPNLNRLYGISDVFSHEDVCKKLSMYMDDFLNALRKIESLGFIETIRSGQYFVRKYFTQDNDKKYGQSYDNFL
ncbi:MAG: hypothetical protein ACI9QD_001248 [Thermoproteota archaeon]|jgi:hypothetical protein